MSRKVICLTEEKVPEQILTLSPLPTKIDHKLAEDVNAHVNSWVHHQHELSVHSNLIYKRVSDEVKRKGEDIRNV